MRVLGEGIVKIGEPTIFMPIGFDRNGGGPNTTWRASCVSPPYTCYDFRPHVKQDDPSTQTLQNYMRDTATRIGDIVSQVRGTWDTVKFGMPNGPQPRPVGFRIIFQGSTPVPGGR